MLHVIGIGPGQAEWLPPAVHKVVAQCDVLIGGQRALQLFACLNKSQYPLSGNLAQSMELIKGFLQEQKAIGILVSGDPGFFSFLPALRREFPEEEVLVYPGISSLQFAFAKAGIPWQEALFVSVHGRALSSLPLSFSRPLAVLTGGENTPQEVAKYFGKRGLNPVISVGNALSYPEETWDTLDAKQLVSDFRTFGNAIMIIYPVTSQSTPPSGLRIGIPDNEFIRGKVPMTKAEIRIQVLAKAQISPSDDVLDVGAGTGSISIEAALIADKGMVYAVETDPEAQELIRENKHKFQVPNLELVSGAAPEVLVQVRPVNVCIIGGSKGRLGEILAQIPLVKGGRLVMTAVTLENAAKGLEILKSLDYEEIEAISLQVVRWPEINNLHIAQALNPVFIISARKGGNI